MTTEIEIPVFDNVGNLIDFEPIEVQFPICVVSSNWLYKQYKVMTENSCYEVTKFRDNRNYQLCKVDHEKANEPFKVDELSKLLGFRHWRFGMGKPEMIPCKLSELNEDTKEMGLAFFSLLELVTP
ncbi:MULTISPECIES: hypothetical protein [unclassified Arcicella]|uniref:hypothetical protein n=1 Tax=unclassified Arcicella TaxID=2644986 RepID=UPI00285BF757|nr:MULTISPECIES: hypothetical protein [unclassified Arcicella]MDR6564928.1 hypothetical protein [Arcicella sp. BE51]MDR6814718.1 hypothetical protein [Arcicella sp. BE140]MDR6826164.1 hypothetical protein [Arcicella sp. BE139]